jgi:hypothetical protein
MRDVTVRIRLFLVLLAIISAPSNSLSTTVVAVKTSKEIYLGADSKVTDTFGNAAERRACKIVQSGRVFFAYAGFARDAKNGFSIPEIAKRSLASGKTLSIQAKTEAMAKVIVTELTRYLPKMKDESFVTFREKIEGKTFLRIVVAGFDKGRPAIFVRLFRYGMTTDGRGGVLVSADDCDGKCSAPVTTRFLGETDAIVGLPEESKNFWNDGFAAGIRKLIEIQIAARDEYVGPPIDILRIDAKRATWIQKKDECLAVKPLR